MANLKEDVDELRRTVIKLQQSHIKWKKVVYKDETNEDNWNLADNQLQPFNENKDMFNREEIKTFIKKVKEDIDEKVNRQYGSESYIKGLNYVKEIIDKRAGRL